MTEDEKSELIYLRNVLQAVRKELGAATVKAEGWPAFDRSHQLLVRLRKAADMEGK